MSLVPCYECGEQVSTFAPSCPKCGAPVDASASQSVKPQPQSSVTPSVQPGAKSDLGVQLLIGFGVVLVVTIGLMVLIVSNSTPGNKSVAPSPAVATAEAVIAKSGETSDSGALARTADSIVETLSPTTLKTTSAGKLLRAIYAVELAPASIKRNSWLVLARPIAGKASETSASKARVSQLPSSGSTDDDRVAANDVMANARHLCNIHEDSPSLVVECHANLPIERRLEFAAAIANADAVLTGRARNIYFYIEGQQFAQADGLNGIRLK